MNILYQCSEYPPFRNGGIGTATKIVAEEMARRGHRVYIVGYYTELKQREMVEEINNVTIYRYNLGTRRGKKRQRFFSVLNHIRLAGFFVQRELTWYENKIAELINKHRIDVYEMTDFYAFNRYHTYLHFRNFTIPIILRVHGSASCLLHCSDNDDEVILYNDRAHFKRADYLCSVSCFAESYVLEKFPDINFEGRKVVYNPIEHGFLNSNNPSENKIILFIGKLIKTKGVISVVKAFDRVSKDFPDWELHLIGGGDSGFIKENVSEDSQKKIINHGFCNRTKIAEEIDRCAFACIPSYFENFSMVPLEIMGRSRTIIFTNRTSGNEVVANGVDGFTVNPDNIDEICDKMRILIENREMRDQFADRGYEKISTLFSAKYIVNELEELYHFAVKGSV